MWVALAMMLAVIAGSLGLGMWSQRRTRHR